MSLYRAYERSRMAIGCIIAGIFGAVIPFCMSSLKDAEHFCPSCIFRIEMVANLGGFLIARFNRTKNDSHTVVSLVPTNKPFANK
jgi:LITAF-like zinc ribbon domain